MQTLQASIMAANDLNILSLFNNVHAMLTPPKGISMDSMVILFFVWDCYFPPFIFPNDLC